MKTGFRTLGTLALAVPLALGLAACDDDGPTGPRPIPVGDVAQLYQTVTFTFDPQGAAPAGDVLAAFEGAGVDFELNIAQTGTFQIFYRDPTSGEVRTFGGQVQMTTEGPELVFASQAAADQLVLPLRLPLEWNGESETLSFSGTAAVSRTRLQQLFPDLYGEEPWTTSTISGTLTVAFQPEPEGS